MALADLHNDGKRPFPRAVAEWAGDTLASLIEPCGRCLGTDAVWMGDPDAGDGDEVWQEPCPECVGGYVPSERLRSVVGAGLGLDVLRLMEEGEEGRPGNEPTKAREK